LQHSASYYREETVYGNSKLYPKDFNDWTSPNEATKKEGLPCLTNAEYLYGSATVWQKCNPNPET